MDFIARHGQSDSVGYCIDTRNRMRLLTSLLSPPCAQGLCEVWARTANTRRHNCGRDTDMAVNTLPHDQHCQNEDEVTAVISP